MPDILVGDPITAADQPPAAWAFSVAAITNITSTSYIPGSPAVEVTFTAPTSGRVLLTVGIGACDGGTARVFLSPEVRETDLNGTVVLAANEARRGVCVPGEASVPAQRSRTTLLEGLTPGGVYYARALYKVTGGSTADLSMRSLLITPTPLGSAGAGRPVRALDYPPASWSQDTTTINNPTNSSYAPGSPTVEVTFTAPTSGRVLLVVGGSLGNAASADRIFLSPEVRETDVNGTVVLVPAVTKHGVGSDNSASGVTFMSRESVLEGLRPGGLYYARLMHLVQTGDPGSSTGDITVRELVVASLP